MDTTARADRAFALGKEAGQAAGSWVIDGNTSRETAERILRGYDDGDPEIMAMEPSSLSGEWADGMTPASLATELELPEDQHGSELHQLCTDYELGYSEGFWNSVTSAARYITEAEECERQRQINARSCAILRTSRYGFKSQGS